MIVKCHKYGYIWNFKGRLMRATCPNCGDKCSINKCSIVKEKIIKYGYIEENLINVKH